jgi:hypothetical protein
MFPNRPRCLLLRILFGAICCLSGTHAVGHEISPYRLSSASGQTINASPVYDGVVRGLPLQSGGVLRVLYSPSKRQRKGIVLMFAGDTGELDIDKTAVVSNVPAMTVSPHPRMATTA